MIFFFLFLVRVWIILVFICYNNIFVNGISWWCLNWWCFNLGDVGIIEFKVIGFFFFMLYNLYVCKYLVISN